MILEVKETPVAPIAGLKVRGVGGTSSLVKVAIPTFKFLLLSITVVPPIATGVVQRAMLMPVTTCALLMVLRTPTVRLLLSVFVPSGV